MIGLADIEDARAQIRSVIRATPVDQSDSFTRLAGRPVILKPEERQRTGSFKIRGAYNLVSRLPAGTEVVAASAGNHAQGVALAARLTGLRATIFMPVGAHLAVGADLTQAGDEIDVADLVALPAPTSRVHDGEAEGEVMSVDRFGNVQLSIPAAEADMLGIGIGTPLVVRAGRRQLTIPFADTFAAVAPGEIVAFTDSAGLISLAVNAGDAAQELGLPPGAHVRLSLARQQ